MIPTILFALCTVALAHPTARSLPVQPVARDCDNSTSATIKLDDGVLTGTPLGDTGVVQYLGIPYAKPPVGDLRFRLPEINDPYTGEINATAYGRACIQLTQGSDNAVNMSANASAVLNTFANPAFPDSEDCASTLPCALTLANISPGLTINVVTPANATADSKLPIAFVRHPIYNLDVWYLPARTH
jgi:acetylcholinesterase